MSINIGICGFGKMGQIRAEAIEDHDGDLVVRKIFDDALPPNPPYSAAASVDEIVDDPDIDAVIICLPNFLNYPTTLAALKAGKHVFCEKPPAFTAAQVEEIRAAEREAGTVLMYGFNHRHHDAVVEMHKQISRGEHGRLLWMRGRYGKSVDADFLSTWRADPALAGGGILLDQGIHMLDLMLFLSGKPFDEVNAMVSNLYWKTPGIEDNVFAIFRNSETGLCASIHSTMTQWRHLFSLEVFLERGYMVLNGLKTSSGTYGEEVLAIAKNRAKAPAATWDDEERLHYEVDTSWGREIEHFATCIATGTPVEYGSSLHALEVMQLVDRVYAHERHIGQNLHTDLGGSA
ncbi:Gfo/Idh/MocA family protein [Parasphingopyxis marina]|uniref:Gfo/Idh/MocA family oxidoreductase n=1 Tax=Parasphingopyxis marina TaxID=2761622 RepID=A0A842HU22_9SPHN|nr:Gfo/Idh/MocA family oxidoreductase [Parasphingopyxis marina]MBC2776033.1 Gfo/Idh/MocA family oxidoreductase [Parasphingopyxis marina]